MTTDFLSVGHAADDMEGADGAASDVSSTSTSSASAASFTEDSPRASPSSSPPAELSPVDNAPRDAQACPVFSVDDAFESF